MPVKKKKRRFTEEELVNAVLKNISIAGVLKDLSLSPSGGNYKEFNKLVSQLGLNTSHFLGQGHYKGCKKIPVHTPTPLE